MLGRVLAIVADKEGRDATQRMFIPPATLSYGEQECAQFHFEEGLRFKVQGLGFKYWYRS